MYLLPRSGKDIIGKEKQRLMHLMNIDIEI